MRRLVVGLLVVLSAIASGVAPVTAADMVTFQGFVVHPGGDGIDGVCVEVEDTALNSEVTLTDVDGSFEVELPVGTGQFRVHFYTVDACGALGLPPAADDYVAEWWDNGTDRASATIITAGADETVTGLIATLAKDTDGYVEGIVTDNLGNPIEGIVVWRAGEFDGMPFLTTGDSTDAQGRYQLISPPGDILILFDDVAGVGYEDEWYDDTDFANADWVTVTTGATVTGIDAALDSTTSGTVERLAGPDRFATAVAISSQFASPVDTVFVATASDFPDALATVPAAAAVGSPVVLVLRDVIPGIVKDEIERLDPGNIIVVGGSGVISEAVVAQLETVAPVERLAGADRFATAVAVSQRFFTGAGPHVAYIATGFSFPDALAGGPAAELNYLFGGLGRGPILLTNTSSLPGSTRAELLRLAPEKIVVLGGTGAVSDGVVAELEAIAPVERLSGPDRYSTASAIALAVTPVGPDVVYVATGLNFPDALAGGALAARDRGPILLVTSDAIPAATKEALIGLEPKSIVVLGGSGAVSDEVELMLAPFVVP